MSIIYPPELADGTLEEKNRSAISSLEEILGVTFRGWQRKQISALLDRTGGFCSFNEILCTVPRRNGKSFGVLCYAVSQALSGRKVLVIAQSEKGQSALIEELDGIISEAKPEVKDALQVKRRSVRSRDGHGRGKIDVQVSSSGSSSARGGGYSCVIFDETLESLTESARQAIIPMVASYVDKPGWQIIYSSTPPADASVKASSLTPFDAVLSEHLRAALGLDKPVDGAATLFYGVTEVPDFDDEETLKAASPAYSEGKISRRAITVGARGMTPAQKATEFWGYYPWQRIEAAARGTIVEIPVVSPETVDTRNFSYCALGVGAHADASGYTAVLVTYNSIKERFFAFFLGSFVSFGDVTNLIKEALFTRGIFGAVVVDPQGIYVDSSHLQGAGITRHLSFISDATRAGEDVVFAGKKDTTQLFNFATEPRYLKNLSFVSEKPSSASGDSKWEIKAFQESVSIEKRFMASDGSLSSRVTSFPRIFSSKTPSVSAAVEAALAAKTILVLNGQGSF